MTDVPHSQSLLQGRLRAASGWLFWLGVALVVLGIAAIVFPMMSTLVATLLVGWVLLIAGVFGLFGSFSIHGTGPFFGALLIALLTIAAGLFLLRNPLAGALALTLMLGVIFVLQGTSEIVFAFEMRPHGAWVGMLLSGIASLLVAALIAAGWPGISAIALGILLGVNFVSSGLGYIFVSRMVRPAA